MRPLCSFRRHPRRHVVRGVTIPELLTVVVILALLMIVSFQGYGIFRQKAEIVDATTKLKNMHAALQNYLTTKQTWPHEPDNVPDAALWKWWMAEMKPFGLSQMDWFSNAHLRLVNGLRKQEGQSQEESSEIDKLEKMEFPSFLPSNFEDYDDAYESKNHPWAMETGEYHGDAGILSVMPNGVVQKMPSLSIKKMATSH